METGGLMSMGLIEVLNLDHWKPLPDITTWYLIKDTQKTSTLFTGRGREKSDPQINSTYMVQYKDLPNEIRKTDQENDYA